MLARSATKTEAEDNEPGDGPGSLVELKQLL